MMDFLKTTYWLLLSCCQWVPVVSPKSWLEQLNFEVAPSRQYYEDFFRLWQADGSDIRTSENSLENPVLVVRTPDNTLRSLRKVQIRIGQNFRTSLSTVRIKIGQFWTEPLTPLPDKNPRPAGRPVHSPDKNRTSGFERPYILLQCSSSRVVVVA